MLQQEVKTQREVQSAKRDLPNSPLPETYLSYKQSYSNTDSNASYHALFSSRSLPNSIMHNGQARLAVIEVPASVSKQEQNSESIMGTNALLASTIRGYAETIKGPEKNITLIAQSSTFDKTLKANISALSVENLERVMREAYGDALDPGFKTDKNVITFSLRNGSEKLVLIRYTSEGERDKGPGQLQGAASEASALIVIGNTKDGTHSLQIAAENPRTADKHANPIINDSVQTAIKLGTELQLQGQIPVIGGQKILFKDIDDSEKFTVLRNAFKSGYRFLAEEHEGKQSIKVYRISSDGVGEDLGIKLEFAKPTISTYKTFASDRAEQLYQVTSKLLEAEPVAIIGSSSSIALRGDISKIQDISQTPLGVMRAGLEKGYTVHYVGNATSENESVERYQIYKTINGKKIAVGNPVDIKTSENSDLEKRDQALANKMSAILGEPQYEFVYQGKIISLLEKKDFPELYLALNNGDLKLENIETLNDKRTGASLELHSYTFKFQDGAGQTQTVPLVMSASGQENYLENVNQVIKAIKNGEPLIAIPTIDKEKYHVLAASSRPNDVEVYKEANNVRYEIVDLGTVKNAQVFGLRNLSTFELVEVKTKGNFQTVTGNIDLTFSYQGSSRDGKLKEALDSALLKDVEDTKLRLQNELRNSVQKELQNIAADERRGIQWADSTKTRLRTQLANVEEAVGPAVNSRQTEYLTRRKTNEKIETLVANEDVTQLMKYASGLLKQEDQETHRQYITGVGYRYADALGQILSKKALERGMGEDFAREIRRADMAIYDTLAVSYIKAKPQIEALLSAGEGSEADQVVKDRMERFALSIAKIVIDKRKEQGSEIVAGPNSKVAVILGGGSDFSAEAVRKTLTHFGVPEKSIYTSKDPGNNGDWGKIVPLALSKDQSNGESLIYIWGHADSGGFDFMKMNVLADTIINSVKPQVSPLGEKVVDLGKLSLVFEGCYVGSLGGKFYVDLEQAAKKKGMTISTPPNMYSSVQRSELSKNSLTSTIDGEKRQGAPLSLFQETAVSLPKSSTGITTNDLFEVADRLQQNFTNQAEGFKYQRLSMHIPHMGLDLGIQSPVIFDSKPVTFKSLFEQIENHMNSEEIRKNAEPVRLAPPSSEAGTIMIHLSSLDNKFSSSAA